MLLLIDKPKGLTSHDVVSRIRKMTGEKKVGHGGTLDPNATGLLVIGVSRMGTKKLGHFLKGNDKEYIAEICLGEERDTHDPEGKITEKTELSSDNLTVDQIRSILDEFIGKQEQIPPAHSAVRIKGKKAYELAREGRQVDMKPRLIEIYSIELLNYDYPILEVITKVSSGTYIRSLARDLGRRFGTYAYLKNLKRTKIGDLSIEDAVPLSELTPDNWKDYIIET